MHRCHVHVTIRRQTHQLLPLISLLNVPTFAVYVLTVTLFATKRYFLSLIAPLAKVIYLHFPGAFIVIRRLETVLHLLLLSMSSINQTENAVFSLPLHVLCFRKAIYVQCTTRTYLTIFKRNSRLKKRFFLDEIASFNILENNYFCS